MESLSERGCGTWRVEPTVRQLEAARACLDPSARVVVLDEAIRSGKTQAGARILLEWAVEQPATYLVARSTYRSLKDSTEKALLFGDGGLPALIPPQLVGQYTRTPSFFALAGGGCVTAVRAESRFVDAAGVAAVLGVERSWVYEHAAAELRPRRLGSDRLRRGAELIISRTWAN
jgi:hypothetical protein